MLFLIPVTSSVKAKQEEKKDEKRVEEKWGWVSHLDVSCSSMPFFPVE
jgi:hypothetical protein